ncbi:hypothetical protein LCGC14_1990160, partial [marine sediment metagenome]
MKLKYRLTAIILANAFVNPIYAQTVEINATELANLKAQILALQNRLSQLEEQADASTSQLASNADTKAELASQEGSDTILESKDGITVGGAIRTNYSYTSYDEGNKNRGGDFDFDIFRLNLSGTIGDVSLNGEIRFFDYMTAIKYAYVG